MRLLYVQCPGRTASQPSKWSVDAVWAHALAGLIRLTTLALVVTYRFLLSRRQKPRFQMVHAAGVMEPAQRLESRAIKVWLRTPPRSATRARQGNPELSSSILESLGICAE